MNKSGKRTILIELIKQTQQDIDVTHAKFPEPFHDLENFENFEDLEKSFYLFINFLAEFPHDFYDMFNEYPRFSECISRSDVIVAVVNVFCHQYFTDHENFKQRLLLIDIHRV